MMKKSKRSLAFILLVLALVSAIYWQVGTVMLTAVRIPVGSPPKDLPVEDVAFDTDQGITIRGWLTVPANPQAVVLLCHGIVANRSQLIERANILYQNHYAALAIDMRGHGESSGNQLTFGLSESRDAAAAVQLIRKRLPGLPVVALGFSLGGAALLLGESPLPIDGLIIESVFSSLRATTYRRMAYYLPFASQVVAEALLFQTQLRLGISAELISPEMGIALYDIPTLIISGAADPFATTDQQQALFAAVRGPKQLWLVPGAEHEDLRSRATVEYDRRLLEFVGSVVSNKSRSSRME